MHFIFAHAVFKINRDDFKKAFSKSMLTLLRAAPLRPIDVTVASSNLGDDFRNSFF